MASDDYQMNTIYEGKLPSNYNRPADHKEVDVKQGAGATENMIFIIQGKIGLEATEDKIAVLTDKFRSGYECTVCDETGVIQKCECEKTDTPGFNRLGGACKICQGNYLATHGQICWRCKGSGQTIIIPESTKSMPTSGVIVSAGPKCVSRKLGERVLYGAHTGYNLPFKGNVRIRIMRENEPLCILYKIDPNATMEDFQLLTEPINNSGELKA